MNILRGQAFSNRHGTIFDLITFEDVDDTFIKNKAEVDRFHKVLDEAMNGAVDLNNLLRGKMTSVLFRKSKGGYYVHSAVHFDHDFSARCTIVEIMTKDAFGLLYRIGSVISSHGCNIEVALITTEGHRAIDVFYITHQGKKLPPELEKRLEYDLNQTLVEV
jgi:[protein-PII] uridylyltransferase